MNTSRAAAITLLCGLAIVFGCAPQQPAEPPDNRAADEAAIRAADAAWSKTAEAKDVNAMVGYFTDDGVILWPNEPIADGKDAIRKSATALFSLPGFSLKWQSAKVEAARSGDMGYSRGAYEFSMTDPKGQPIMDHGKYLTIWKKQADGTWKVLIDTFNSDVPVAPPPPAK